MIYENPSTLGILKFVISSTTIFNIKSHLFSSIEPDMINYYTFHESSNQILSIQNTLWNNGDELSAFKQSLKIMV